VLTDDVVVVVELTEEAVVLRTSSTKLNCVFGVGVADFCGSENISMMVCIGIGIHPSPVLECSASASSSRGSVNDDDPVLLPNDPELVPNDPELVPKDPELEPSDPELLPKDPELVPKDPELVPELVPEFELKDPELAPELEAKDPELVPNNPELEPEEPELAPE
jgi:hypothetical protein